MKLKRLLIFLLLITFAGLVFDSCNPGIDKITRIEMFQDDLNKQVEASQESANRMMAHFLDGATTKYSQMATPDWWDVSSFQFNYITFSITNMQEGSGDIVNASISSIGGPNGPITFTMIKSGADWYIQKVYYGGTYIID